MTQQLIEPAPPARAHPATAAVRRLDDYARALGWAGGAPVELVGLLHCSLTRRLDDPAYAANALCPGGWPVEVSFAEAEPGALRVDVQRGDPDLGPATRLEESLDWARTPPDLVAQWQPLMQPRRFGAFTAAVVRPGGSVRKVYLELARRPSEVGWPAAFAHPVAQLAACVPGLRPHLVSLLGDTADRLYLEADAGVALLDLFDWATPLGLAPQVPALIEAIRRLTGGALVLSPGGLLLAVRPLIGGGVELKLELTRQMLVPDAATVVESVLAGRPAGLRAYRRWRRALAPAIELSVVSVRIATGLPSPELNVYAGLVSAEFVGSLGSRGWAA